MGQPLSYLDCHNSRVERNTPDRVFPEGDDAVALYAADILESGLKLLIEVVESEVNDQSPTGLSRHADHRICASFVERWMYGAEALCDLLQRETAALNAALNHKSGKERWETVAASCQKIVGACEQLYSHAQEWRSYRLSGAWKLVFKELAAFNSAIFEQMATLPEKIRHSVTTDHPGDCVEIVLDLQPPKDFESRIQAAMAWAAAEARPPTWLFGAQRRQEPWENFLSPFFVRGGAKVG